MEEEVASILNLVTPSTIVISAIVDVVDFQVSKVDSLCQQIESDSD